MSALPAKRAFAAAITLPMSPGPLAPVSATIAAAAQAAGLSYAFLPVASGYQSPEEIARFAGLLESMPKPILAFCRSGTRSGKLVRAALGA